VPRLVDVDWVVDLLHRSVSGTPSRDCPYCLVGLLEVRASICGRNVGTGRMPDDEVALVTVTRLVFHRGPVKNKNVYPVLCRTSRSYHLLLVFPTGITCASHINL
jgi:hypothetical protein